MRCRGGKAIYIRSAIYGHENKNCEAENSKKIVSDICDGKTMCKVAASFSVFGNPCVGIFKYLKVGYICIICT